MTLTNLDHYRTHHYERTRHLRQRAPPHAYPAGGIPGFLCSSNIERRNNPQRSLAVCVSKPSAVPSPSSPKPTPAPSARSDSTAPCFVTVLRHLQSRYPHVHLQGMATVSIAVGLPLFAAHISRGTRTLGNLRAKSIMLQVRLSCYQPALLVSPPPLPRIRVRCYLAHQVIVLDSCDRILL